MALGPGKYDSQCTLVREATKASGVVLVIVDGTLGSGFSVQLEPREQFRLPQLLRALATLIESDMQG